MGGVDGALAHGGELPETESDLLALPGVGSYTAAAVLAFAFRRRSLVLDVNVRRVLARIDQGVEHPARSETAGERERGWRFVPDDDEQASLWAADGAGRDGVHREITEMRPVPRGGSLLLAGEGLPGLGRTAAGGAVLGGNRPAVPGPDHGGAARVAVTSATW